MYKFWGTTIESHPWYAVVPGTQGAIATPRWQALHQVARDIDFLTTAEYLVDHHRAAGTKVLTQQLDQAKLAGQEGRFYTMRMLLDGIIGKARQQ